MGSDSMDGHMGIRHAVLRFALAAPVDVAIAEPGFAVRGPARKGWALSCRYFACLRVGHSDLDMMAEADSEHVAKSALPTKSQARWGLGAVWFQDLEGFVAVDDHSSHSIDCMDSAARRTYNMKTCRGELRKDRRDVTTQDAAMIAVPEMQMDSRQMDVVVGAAEFVSRKVRKVSEPGQIVLGK